MSDAVLDRLLDGNRDHAATLAEGHYDRVRDAQRPPAVSICCSDSRVPQAAMFGVEEPGWLFTSSNIGNQVWDRVDGDLVADGNVLYPLLYTGTRTVAVVGHTGCGAVTAAHEAATSDPIESPPGVRERVALLVPAIEAALDAIDPGLGEDETVNRLVEANVDRQVGFLQAADGVPDDGRVYGFVYDLHGAYGGPPGRAYLVNHRGTRDPERLREHAPDGHEAAARRLDA
jgi:carbonic anhydrase